MRQFKLKNAIGESYDLNDLKFFLYSPSNLGYKKNLSYMKVGHRFISTKEEVSQPSPQGTIRFKSPNAYEKYYAFVRFATKEPLQLEYCPEETSYYLDCIIESIDKTEISSRGLHCTVNLKALGYYYREYAMEAGTDIQDGKIYDYTYPFRYADNGAGTVALDVDSNMESPTKISIYGPTTNPTWQLYVNNVLKETGECTVEIPAGRRLVIDSMTIPYSITEQDLIGNVIYDRYNLSNIETERFFFLRNGRNRISVAHDGASIPKLKVEARVLYETV